MNVMVVGVVRCEPLDRVERQLVTAVIVDRLQRRDGEEERRLTDGHERGGFRNRCAEGVEQESFERVVVQCAVCVRDIQAVVPRVEVLVRPSVHVHAAVEEILPGINDEPKR